jgi:2-polyprenyl-3-methyl-5-hydroxy-6-metoxy-1,4-benzoquinol methylase
MNEVSEWLVVIAIVLVVLVLLLRRRRRHRSADVYGVDTARWLHAKLPARRDVWFNFGDWSVRHESFALQCEAFVDALLREVDVGDGSHLRVLDIGCGASGAQSSYVERVLLKRLHGDALLSVVALDPALDVALVPPPLAHTTLLRCGLQDLPVEHGDFNVVMAADSLYHVPLSRRALFRELAARFDPTASRCWLAVTDLVALPSRRGPWWRTLARWALARLLRAPNLGQELSLAQYAELLEEAHFVDVRATDVTDVVLAPFAAYLEAQLDHTDGVLAWHKKVQFRAFAQLLRFALRHELFAYVRVTAARVK